VQVKRVGCRLQKRAAESIALILKFGISVPIYFKIAIEIDNSGLIDWDKETLLNVYFN